MLLPSGYWHHEGCCITVLYHDVNASEELNHDVSASEVQTTCPQVTHVSLLDVCHKGSDCTMRVVWDNEEQQAADALAAPQCGAMPEVQAPDDPSCKDLLFDCWLHCACARVTFLTMDIFWLDQLLQPPCDSVSRLDVQVQQIEGLHSHTSLGSGSLHCALHSTTQLATCRYQQSCSCDLCGA